MNGAEISREFGVTPEAVYYRLRTWGVKNERRYRRFDPPKNDLRDLYTKMSMQKIADHYGVGETVVFMRLKEHGISGIDRAERMS